MPKKPQENEEIQRILEVTQTLLRVLDLSNREIERRLGLSPSYLTRVFTGYVEVKLEHILEIARAMGLSAAEFFSFVYPELPEPPSEAAATIRKRLAQLQPSKPVPALSHHPPTNEQLHRAAEEMLRKAMEMLKTPYPK